MISLRRMAQTSRGAAVVSAADEFSFSKAAPLDTTRADTLHGPIVTGSSASKVTATPTGSTHVLFSVHG